MPTAYVVTSKSGSQAVLDNPDAAHRIATTWLLMDGGASIHESNRLKRWWLQGTDAPQEATFNRLDGGTVTIARLTEDAARKALDRADNLSRASRVLEDTARWYAAQEAAAKPAPLLTHEVGRQSVEDYAASTDRYFYAAAHQGWYAVFEQTGGRPDFWRECVGGLLYVTDAEVMAQRLNALRLPKVAQ